MGTDRRTTLVRLAALVSGLAAATGLAAFATTTAPGPAPGPRAVVLAELFTSEGCSSCPAADALLREWLASQSVDGVELLALGEHVDYWDRLGWRDPYSSAEFSRRQAEYDRAVFRSRGSYTPQLVVDGRLECIGSDGSAVRRAVLDAARQPKGTVSVAATPAPAGGLDVRVAVRMPPGLARTGPAEVMVAVTEDGLVSEVARGENRGRRLRHSAVTRRLTVAGVLDAAASEVSLTLPVAMAADWTAAHLRVVAFVQERASRRIIGAGATPLGLGGASR